MFPFKFGVMFGDIGHGGLLFLLGIWLVLCNNSIIRNKNPFMALSEGRFLFILLGFFAFYCGFMYNDFFSLPLNLFGSCYTAEHLGESTVSEHTEGCVYPFGMDPMWYRATNELSVFNSLKMKMAVIIGVT